MLASFICKVLLSQEEILIFSDLLYIRTLILALNTTFVLKSQQEITLLSQLSHANIVQYYGSDLVQVNFSLLWRPFWFS